MRSRCALIMFARYPRPGEVKTRLGREIGMEEAARLYKAIAERTFAIGSTIAGTGAMVYLFFEPSSNEDEMRSWVTHGFRYFPQKGDGLGDRMRDSFEIAFDEGAERIVIIGTDIPDLTVSLIEEAFESLEESDVVLGPSEDGGYYLLGMKKLLPDLFSGISWSTESVFAETIRKLRGLGIRWKEMKSLPDLDTRSDYDRLFGTGNEIW